MDFSSLLAGFESGVHVAPCIFSDSSFADRFACGARIVGSSGCAVSRIIKKLFRKTSLQFERFKDVADG